ncbi:MAG TPA: hypothetical protein VGD87_07115, partial [Archangium sp.]
MSSTPAAVEPSKPAPAPATPTEAFHPSASGAAPTTLEGTSAGYVSPTKVQCPFSAEEKKALSKKIPCP